MADWVVTLTFNDDGANIEMMDRWERELAALDASIARIPGEGIAVTVYAPEHLRLMDLTDKIVGEVCYVLQADPIGAEFLDEVAYARRAEAPSMPELMSAAEIADLLGVTRQRVHQLRNTNAFPAPLADLRGGAVWDAAAVRKFDSEWTRTPGRPRASVVGVMSGKMGPVKIRATSAGTRIQRSAKTGRLVARDSSRSRTS